MEFNFFILRYKEKPVNGKQGGRNSQVTVFFVPQKLHYSKKSPFVIPLTIISIDISAYILYYN